MGSAAKYNWTKEKMIRTLLVGCDIERGAIAKYYHQLYHGIRTTVGTKDNFVAIWYTQRRGAVVTIHNNFTKVNE